MAVGLALACRLVPPMSDSDDDRAQAPSSSMAQPDYWWYRARSELLATVLGPRLSADARVLDIGSADGPSVDWMTKVAARVPVDIDIESLAPGGVCASALQLPFRSGSFDVAAAFDVLEHCDPESQALDEFRRVLRPGGQLFLAVPAYQWAWTRFDVDAGHFRRYTRRRLTAAVERAGFGVDRCTHIFAGTFPAFAAERLVRKLRPGGPEPDTSLPEVSPALDRLFMGLSHADVRWLARRDLPFGSSVVLAATKRA